MARWSSQSSRVQALTPRATGRGGRRRWVASRLTEKAGALAAGVSSQAHLLGDQIVHGADERADAPAAGPGPGPLRRQRHPVRRGLLVFGLGAAVAYFLDRKSGRERRERARVRTTAAALHLGNGLEHASRIARKAAELAQKKPDSTTEY